MATTKSITIFDRVQDPPKPEEPREFVSHPDKGLEVKPKKDSTKTGS